MTPDASAAWKTIAEILPPECLAALADGLRRDDPALVQGASTVPPALTWNADEPVLAADALGYALWHGRGLVTAGQVDDARCQLLQEVGPRHSFGMAFVNWLDDTPRDVMRREILREISGTAGIMGQAVSAESSDSG